MKSILSKLIFSLIFSLLVLQSLLAQDLKLYPEEINAFDAFRKHKDIKAKKLASQITKQDPKTGLSFFILGLLIRENEGNVVRALRFYNTAIANIEKQCTDQPKPRQPLCVKWHSIVLQEKVDALKSLDRPQEAYDLILRYDKLYFPNLDSEKIWPLVKLRRLDEAKDIALRLLREGNKKFKVRAYNSLCVVAAEENERKKSDLACTRGAQETKSMVIYYNAAISKYAVFDLEAAEKISVAGSLLPNDMYGSIWESLVAHYTLEERFAEAISAAEKAAKVHQGFSALKEEMSRSTFLNIMAQLLFAVGSFEDAYHFANESYHIPDRTGGTSVDPSFIKLIHSLNFYHFLTAYERELRQEVNYKQSYLEKTRLVAQRVELALTKKLLLTKIKRLLQEKEAFVWLVAPYPTSRGLVETIPYWMQSTLADIMGMYFYEQAIQAARVWEKEYPRKREIYFNAALALNYFVNGEEKKALPRAQKALLELPQRERLLKSQLKTFLAHYYDESGQLDKAKEFYIDLIRTTPVFIKYLGHQMPVKFIADKSKIARQALDYLEDDPYLRRSSAGIALTIKSQGELLTLCLLDSLNNHVFCKKEKVAKKTVAQVSHNFVRELFSPKIDFTQLDVNSLNGIPTKGTGTKAIQRLFKKKK